MTHSILFSVLLTGAGLLAHATPLPAQSAPEAQTGLKVGSKAPDFTLKSQDGSEHSLGEYLKKGKVALVFHRSADWWPYCQRQLVQLQSSLKDLEVAGVQLVAISYDSMEILQRFAKSKEITFPLLSDPGSKTIEVYGLRNKEAGGTKLDGIPYPGTILIDQDGFVRAKLFFEGYKKRHDGEALLEAVQELP